MTDDNVLDSGLPWLGDRIRQLRAERDIPLAELARRSQISRSYLHQLEQPDPTQRPTPTAVVLFRIARALGVSVADLVEPDRPSPAEMEEADVPPGLKEAATQEGLTVSDVRHLAAIRFRGQQPQSVQRWRLLIQQLELSQVLDQRSERKSDGDPPS